MAATTKPVYWVSWSEPGANVARDFVGGYGPGESAAAEAKARELVAELLSREGISNVRLERHEPAAHTDRPAITTLYPPPES